MKSSVNQKCCFLLFVLAIKTCNIEANKTLSFEHGATGQNWIFLSDIHWLTFQNNAIFPARSTILLQMAIPCIALYYRHITLFQRDCCIYEKVPFCTTTYCKSHHTQPDSFTRTAVCLEGYFSKRCYILLKGLYGRNYICSLKYMEDRTHLF